MSWKRVCCLDDIPLGCALAAEADGERILICRVGAQAIHAIGDRCTHDDEPLGEGRLDGLAIECPRHGARFDVSTGAVLRMPAVTPLAIYPVRILAGWVEIETRGRE